MRSMCCRLQLDKRELRKRGGGLFGSDEFTGSLGVVTINLPQIGYLAHTKEQFFARLNYLMDLAKESLCAKRKVIQHLLDGGLFPYSKRYLSTLNNHFNTIGLCGMNECCLNFLGVDIVNPKGKAFAEEILLHMRQRLADYQEKTGELFNLEATPAESTSYRLASHDKAQYPDIITSGEKAPYYTNSSQLPVDYTNDIFEAMDHQESLQTKYTGGTVFHTFMGEAIKDWRSCRDLVRTVTKNYRIPYITVSPIYSVCKNHGYLNGESRSGSFLLRRQPILSILYIEEKYMSTVRPIAQIEQDIAQIKEELKSVRGTETEVYSRIVGYYRSVRNWNKGKRDEYNQRKQFVIGTNNTHAASGCSQIIGSESSECAESSQVQNGNAVPNGTLNGAAVSYEFFGKTTCPNCPPVKNYLAGSGVNGIFVDVDTAEGLARACEMGVRAAPTVILFNENGEEAGRAYNVNELSAILEPAAEHVA